ncbi:hypothetical protein IOD13_11540 [Brevibacterium casei]|nr:hypothetical protein [Brevibacterium casei]
MTLSAVSPPASTLTQAATLTTSSPSVASLTAAPQTTASPGKEVNTSD